MAKKAKPKNKGTGKKAATTTTTTTTTTTSSSSTSSSTDKQPVDLAEVRKDISNIVGSNAAELARAVIATGKTGQLAPVKYLFEVCGLYPASESSSESKPDQESLAHTLMRSLKLPERPVVSEDDEEAGASVAGLSTPEASAKENAQPATDAESGSDVDGKRASEKEAGTGQRAETMP
ncbi:MAG TPA: hypothetical protein VKR60_05475 [Candidatus Sulfotelmatobacter sp.]|nr:hypothetical protein [Candidatus Sulfotelmatobacter sp.]